MASKQSIEPKFINWHEALFMADEEVHCMDWLQRLLYRHLCQRAPFCSTRPLIPNDDNKLWKLSGAKDKQMWIDNKETVLAKWKPVQGGKFFEHKRVTAEYERASKYIADQSTRAKKRWNQEDANMPRHSHGNATAPAAAMPPALPTELNGTEETETETRIKLNSGSGFSAAAPPMSGRQDEKLGQASVSDVGLDQEKPQNPLAAFLDGEPTGKAPYDVVDTWREVYPDLECYAPEEDPMGCMGDIGRMVESGSSCDAMVETIEWLRKSKYWGKEGPGAFKDGLKSFLNAYGTIRGQFNRYKQEKLANQEAKKARRGK